jgi:para-aminobenzoate synthetase component 1
MLRNADRPQVESNEPFVPLAEELLPAPDPEQALLRLARRRRVLFLDSALRHERLGRYSFLTCEPAAFLVRQSDEPGALDAAAALLAAGRAEPLPELPPFQGGVAGLFAYDLNRQLEPVPAARWDEFRVPALAVGLYDVVAAWDHRQQRAWIISQGLPASTPRQRRARAAARLRAFRDWLAAPAVQPDEAIGRTRLLAAAQLAPQFQAGRLPRLTSNFSREGYLQAVERAIEYIYAGDVFQVNLAQRLLHPAVGSSLALYLRLRRRNPATFAAYFDLGRFQLVSASPERFLQVQHGAVEARPIKGTRPRTAWPEADLFAGDELQASVKDCAENVMIVDLLRNDLSRVCQPHSVRVTELCSLEPYPYVQHLVSAVRGLLRPGMGAMDLLRAAFPGGSVTGAPKVRAMQIISELEQVARGAYCGVLAYLGFDGSMDSSILIRTITAGRGWWQAPVGGGIVAASDPAVEYEETWHKAAGLLRAM